MLQIDKTYTLFLDRDGVLNKHLPNAYVLNTAQFEIIDGVLEALKKAASIFGRIVVVTNQQGIGKGLMTEMDLEKIHFYFLEEVKKAGGRIDEIYYCPYLADINPISRKPNTGMALKAKKDFPEIDFSKSIMVGDSWSDMVFGEKLGMYNVFINSSKHIQPDKYPFRYDVAHTSLKEFIDSITQ